VSAAWRIGPVALLAAGACASPPGAPTPAPTAEAYARRVTPFEVLDETGRAYDHPFLGGLNVPRPQLVDIDADGDLDLFLQEYSGQIMFFENVGTPVVARFVWRTGEFGDLAVGEWYRFADLDHDGDFDLLAEEPFSYIRVYRNEGTPQRSTFLLAADTLRDVDGKPIFSDRQNIPNVTDIDCDGHLDLFIGRLVGTVTRYEADGVDDRGVPRFRHVTDRFEDIEIISQIGSRHGANTLAFADADGDGDQDLFWGDFFDPTLLTIENVGSCERPSLRDPAVPFPRNDPVATSGYNAPAFGDLDGDSDLDFLMGVLGGAFNPNVTAGANLFYFEQDGDDTFLLRTRRFADGIDVGNESIPVLVDLDGDGDLDLLVANKLDPEDLQSSVIYRFENRGTPTGPAFALVGRLDVTGLYHYAPAFGDLDGDGDLDMLLGSWKADVAYHRNEGGRAAPRWALADSSIVKLTRGSNTTPTLGDLDGDGLLDLVIGEASGTLNFYRNVGTSREPAFELVSDEFLGLDVGRRSAPNLVDIDGDGDLDLVIGTESDGLWLLRNDGTRSEPRFVRDESYRPPVPPLAVPAFGDLDGDGDLDLLVGGAGGGVVFLQRR
jgi:hypothetical protein